MGLLCIYNSFSRGRDCLAKIEICSLVCVRILFFIGAFSTSVFILFRRNEHFLKPYSFAIFPIMFFIMMAKAYGYNDSWTVFGLSFVRHGQSSILLHNSISGVERHSTESYLLFNEDILASKRY